MQVLFNIIYDSLLGAKLKWHALCPVIDSMNHSSISKVGIADERESAIHDHAAQTKSMTCTHICSCSAAMSCGQMQFKGWKGARSRDMGPSLAEDMTHMSMSALCFVHLQSEVSFEYFRDRFVVEANDPVALNAQVSRRRQLTHCTVAKLAALQSKGVLENASPQGQGCR